MARQQDEPYGYHSDYDSPDDMHREFDVPNTPPLQRHLDDFQYEDYEDDDES